MRKFFLFSFFIMFFCFNAKADYPLIWQRYTADPWAIEYNGRLYMFCSHDTYVPERGYGYYMNDITCISTNDLKNWTDHGEVFSSGDCKWGANNTWAPCVVVRNGKFYMYYGDGGGGGIGVAVSDNPIGPYKDTLDKPLVSYSTPGVINYDANNRQIKPSAGQRGALKDSENWGMWCFDPCVFVDDDGMTYMYFGGANPENSRIIKLKQNMTEIDGDAVKANTPGFFEASCMHKYKGKYYYSYSGYYFNSPGNIEYVMSNKPMTGFSKPSVVMKNPPVNDGNNHHHCIFTYKGEWYMAYHNREVAYQNNESDLRSREYMRSVCLDRLYYNNDGTIKEVIATKDGLPQLQYVNPFDVNEAETMAQGQYIKTCAAKESTFGNRTVVPLKDNAYIKVRGVDFGNQGVSELSAKVYVMGEGMGTIEVRLESPTGLLISSLSVNSAFNANGWHDISSNVKNIRGIYDVYFVFRGNTNGTFMFDNWQFK